MTWTYLKIISVILLIAYRKGFEIKLIPNAVWGGLILGAFTGFLIAMFSIYKGEFYLDIIWKSAIIGEMIGFGFELLGEINEKLAKK
jgi:hypothetical protein